MPRRAVLEFRKFVSYYLKGINGIKEAKLALYSAEDFDKIREIIEQML